MVEVGVGVEAVVVVGVGGMKDDKPAFPHWRINADSSGRCENGLTRRELFSAMAMQGMFSCEGMREISTEDIAKFSTHAADALIKALDDE